MTVNKIDLTQKQLDRIVKVEQEEKELGIETEIANDFICDERDDRREEDNSQNQTIKIGLIGSFGYLL